MVLGYGRIGRKVASTLAAVLTLAAPFALGEALATENASDAKAASAKVVDADKASSQAAKDGKTAKDAQGKTARAKLKKRPKNRVAAKDAAQASGKRAEPRGHDQDEAVVVAKHEASKDEKATKPAAHDGKNAGHNKPAAHKAAPKQAPAPKNDKPAAKPKHDKGEATAKAPANEKTGTSRRGKKASTRLPGGTRKGTKKAETEPERPPCFAPAVTIDRNGLEGQSLSLVDCKGTVLTDAREKLSVLARPWGTPRPELPSHKKTKKPALKTAKKEKPGKDDVEASPEEIAPNVRLLDPGLLSRVESVAKHFPGKNISLVSGYRPKSRGSLHQSARALDFRVAGVANEELVAFCKTLPDTGCGYYPNSSFVHVDVRAPGTGSVTWIDASGPGEAPRYVSQWPPPPEPAPADANANNAAPAGDSKDAAGKPAVEAKEPAAKETVSKETVAKETAAKEANGKAAEEKAPIGKEADIKTADDKDSACGTPSPSKAPAASGTKPAAEPAKKAD